MDFSQLLNFLSKLSKNNDRAWFEKNKETYVTAKANFEAIVTQVLSDLIKFNPELMGLNPKKLPFRIYRDVRFSKDKKPYKINMGARFSPGGKLEQEPGYYLHIAPGNESFIAGGIYMPNPENLAKIRQEIDYNGERLIKILKDKAFKKWFNGMDDFDKLKKMPKGYAPDHPHIELLKNRSFIVSHSFTDAQVKDKKFLRNVIAGYKALKPLNEFLKVALA